MDMSLETPAMLPSAMIAPPLVTADGLGLRAAPGKAHMLGAGAITSALTESRIVTI